MHLDIRTLLVLTSMGALLMSGTMFASLRNYPDNSDGLKSWALGIGLQGMGWGLLATEGHLPYVLCETVPRTLILIALAIQYRSVCEFRHVRFRLGRVVALMVVTIAAFAAFAFTPPHTFEISNLVGKTIVGSGYGAIMLGLCAGTLLYGRQTSSKRITGFAFLLCCLVLVGRIVSAVFIDSNLHGLFAPTPMESACYLSYYCGVVVMSFNFMLMCHERTNEELSRLATRDSLTECFNRGMIDELMARELAKSQRHGGPLSILMIDIDHFKSINDRHGHAAGDSALRLVALTAQGSLRLQDALGRFGGEEFLVLLPNTDGAGAMIVAERLRHNIEQLQIKIETDRFGITISLGTATALNGAVTAEELTHCADVALYGAKSSGRNRVQEGKWEKREIARSGDGEIGSPRNGEAESRGAARGLEAQL